VGDGGNLSRPFILQSSRKKGDAPGRGHSLRKKALCETLSGGETRNSTALVGCKGKKEVEGVYEE